MSASNTIVECQRQLPSVFEDQKDPGYDKKYFSTLRDIIKYTFHIILGCTKLLGLNCLRSWYFKENQVRSLVPSFSSILNCLNCMIKFIFNISDNSTSGTFKLLLSYS